MKVTIENYTQMALRTWCGDNQKERAELGIIGELGEVAEVLKKYLRGDFDEVERDKRLLKELGDVCFYSAILCHLWDTDINNVSDSDRKIDFDFKTECDGDGELYGMYETLGAAFTMMHIRQAGIGDQSDNMKDASLRIHRRIDLMCFEYGFTLEQVMQANIEKLSSRADRGKINGDGDNR